MELHLHALIIVSHPDPGSLSHAVAVQIGEALSLSGSGHTFEIGDLAAEGFDPRYTLADRAAHHRKAPMPTDVAIEQARIDRADSLILVYPVYWWSMPGLLKGWIDRVFANGWAYDDTSAMGVVKKLQHLQIHLVAIGGADEGTYGRHGYFDSMKTQINHGIFDYCGAPVVTSAFLLESDISTEIRHLDTARVIGRNLFKANEQCGATEVRDGAFVS